MCVCAFFGTSLRKANGPSALSLGSLFSCLVNIPVRHLAVHLAATNASGLQPSSRVKLALMHVSCADDAPQQTGGNRVGRLPVLASHNAQYEVISLAFDPLQGRHLAVTGLRDLQVAFRNTMQLPCNTGCLPCLHGLLRLEVDGLQ